ncbi:hypothetical protein LB505_003074 [Fusarium chuoi]|nr:hypothetical protein LB505_003074 [Fusarium chuoi]
MLAKAFLWAAVVIAMPLVEMSPRELHELEVHQPVSKKSTPRSPSQQNHPRCRRRCSRYLRSEHDSSSSRRCDPVPIQ